MCDRGGEMINPLEIQAVEFGKAMRGYQTSEVDKFIDDIFKDYEIIYKENKDHKERIGLLEEQLGTYKNMEKTLNDTLILASDTAETLKSNAVKEAEFINSKAEEEAKRIIEKANGEVMRIKREFDNAKKQVMIFNERYRNLLKSQIELLNKSMDDMSE
jgi:cell division initiation protein